jgi:zinc transport system ATP-binding protein
VNGRARSPVAAGAEPAIALRDVRFHYGGARRPAVLEDITLEVAAGEFIGLVGPNGGGKSTLLKLVLGLLEPDHGSVTVFGRRPRDARALLGYVPQFRTFASDFPISVERAVLQGRLGQTRRLFGYRREDHAIAAQALADVSMADLADRPLATLSGGQLQRVLIARALACAPRILLLDEPTANVDAHVESSLFDLLRTLNRELTIVVVSHDVGFISGYVGRVACLNRRLVCHETSALSGDIINEMYGGAAQIIHHHTHLDPGDAHPPGAGARGPR